MVDQYIVDYVFFIGAIIIAAMFSGWIGGISKPKAGWVSFGLLFMLIVFFELKHFS